MISEDMTFPLRHLPCYIKDTPGETKMIKKLMGIDLAYEVKQNINTICFRIERIGEF